jgi:hypothetical protein
VVALLALPGVAMAAPAPYETPGSIGLLPPRDPSPPPFVTGSPQVGGVLTGNRGTWADDPTPTSEWLRCNAAARTCETTGDTDTRYDVTAADLGQFLVLRVVGRALLSTTTADAVSNPISAAAAGPVAPTNVARPAITGDAREGQTVRASLGQWTGTDPISYTYAWTSCAATCRAVSSSNAYRVTSADVGRRLLVAITARNAVGSGSVQVATGVIARRATTAALKRLSPFPTLLIDGRVAGRITRISTLRLRRVPGGATVNIACKGRGCPYRKSKVRVRKGKSRTVALRKLQRRMREKTTVVITVRKGNTLGKYIRLRFRRAAAPSRVDRCVAPGSSKPVKCP